MKFWSRFKRQYALNYLIFRNGLCVMFGLKRTHLKNPFLLKISIQEEVNALLDGQFKDAKLKKMSPQWKDVGWQVENAAKQSALIMQWCDEEDLEEYFNRVLLEIANLAEFYRKNESEESGYALGTVREIENFFIAMAKKNR